MVPPSETNLLIAAPVKVTNVLGFKAKADEHARVRERVQEQYAGALLFMAISIRICQLKFMLSRLE